MVVTQSRVGQSTPRPSAPSRSNQSRPGQSTIGPGGRATIPSISGGGRSRAKEQYDQPIGPQLPTPTEQYSEPAGPQRESQSIPGRQSQLQRQRQGSNLQSRQGQSTQGPGGRAITPQIQLRTQSQVAEAVRSSTRTQIPQALKVQSRQSIYGPTLPARNLDSRSDILPSGQRDTSTLSALGSYLRGLKTRLQEKKSESYVSALGPTGAFVSASEDTGGRGTVIARVPTANEFSSISKADSTGEVLDRSAKDVVELGETYSQLTKGFDKLSVEEQQSRVSRIRELGGDVNPITNEIIPPQVGIGFGVNKRLVGVDELDTRNPGQVYRSALSLLAAKKAGEVTQSEIEKFKPATNILFSTQQFGKDTALGTIARASAAASPRVAETVAGQAVNVGPYLIPGVGQSLFFTEQGANLGYEIAQKDSLSGGAKSYLQRFPYEAGGVAVVGGVALARGLSPTIKVIRTTETIPSRNPQIFVNPISAKTIVTPKGNKLYEISYAAAGRARRGAEISNVQVVKNRPMFEFFGARGDEIYNSAVPGNTYGLLFPTGIVKTGNLSSRYERALNLLRSQGYTDDEARAALRAYTRSPTNIAISGRGNVIMGATDRDLVMASGELRYEAAQQKMGLFRKTRNFAPFKERTSTLGASLVEKDGVQYFLTESDVVRLFYPRGKPTQEFMKLSQAGRTTRQVQQVSGVKDVGQIELGLNTGNPFGSKALQFNVFEEGSLSRQTIPLRRGTSEGKSTIFVRDAGDDLATIDYGQPFKVDTIPLKPARPSSADVTLMDEQGQDILSTLKSLYGNKVAEGGKNVAARLPKPNLGFPKAPKSGTTIVSGASGKAEQVAGLGSTTNVAAASKFFGTGQYERTEMVATPAAALEPATALSFQPSMNNDIVRLSAPSPTVSKQAERSASSLQVRQIISSRNDSRQAAGLRADTGSGSSLRADAATPIRTKESNKFLSSIRLRDFIRNALKLRNSSIKAPTPIIPAVKLPSGRTGRTTQTTSEESAGTFKIFTKKFGKDVLIGEEESKGEAVRLLKSQLIGTLRASGFVVNPSGQRLKANELNLGNAFRPGKRDPFRVVQRRGFRLVSGGEVAEIKAARRSRSKRARFF